MAAASGETRQLRPGESTVVKIDGARVGVYCDAEARLHAVNAMCTHLSWELDFDPRICAWSCPRHGAKFAIDGTVLEGPATTALSVAEIPKHLRAQSTSPGLETPYGEA